MGSDIDGRQMRGKEGVSIRSNAQQYSLTTKLLDCTTMDLSRHPWRDSCLFDAIVTDPPYGVRAGAKMLGRKDPSKARLVIIDGQPAHLQEDYVPPTQPWEMEDVLNHLVDFAARHLTLYGRLVYWLPTITDEYKEHDVPQHPCLRLVANSVQSFNVWSRRLITMEKVRDYVEAEMQLQEDGGHYGFRNKYFTPNKH
jgi:tRNA (guanine10-N2)-methyltransferase